MGGKSKPSDFGVCKEPPKTKVQKRAEFEKAMRSMIDARSKKDKQNGDS